MVLNVRTKDEISPTLRNIVNQFNEDNKRPLDAFPSQQKSSDQVDDNDRSYNNEVELDGEAYEKYGNWTFDHDDQKSVVDEELDAADTTFPSYHEVYAADYLSKWLSLSHLYF